MPPEQTPKFEHQFPALETLEERTGGKSEHVRAKIAEIEKAIYALESSEVKQEEKTLLAQKLRALTNEYEEAIDGINTENHADLWELNKKMHKDLESSMQYVKKVGSVESIQKNGGKEIINGQETHQTFNTLMQLRKVEVRGKSFNIEPAAGVHVRPLVLKHCIAMTEILQKNPKVKTKKFLAVAGYRAEWNETINGKEQKFVLTPDALLVQIREQDPKDIAVRYESFKDMKRKHIDLLKTIDAVLAKIPEDKQERTRQLLDHVGSKDPEIEALLKNITPTEFDQYTNAATAWIEAREVYKKNDEKEGVWSMLKGRMADGRAVSVRERTGMEPGDLVFHRRVQLEDAPHAYEEIIAYGRRQSKKDKTTETNFDEEENLLSKTEHIDNGQVRITTTEGNRTIEKVFENNEQLSATIRGKNGQKIFEAVKPKTGESAQWERTIFNKEGRKLSIEKELSEGKRKEIQALVKQYRNLGPDAEEEKKEIAAKLDSYAALVLKRIGAKMTTLEEVHSFLEAYMQYALDSDDPNDPYKEGVMLGGEYIQSIGETLFIRPKKEGQILGDCEEFAEVAKHLLNGQSGKQKRGEAITIMIPKHAIALRIWKEENGNYVGESIDVDGPDHQENGFATQSEAFNALMRRFQRSSNVDPDGQKVHKMSPYRLMPTIKIEGPGTYRKIPIPIEAITDAALRRELEKIDQLWGKKALEEAKETAETLIQKYPNNPTVMSTLALFLPLEHAETLFRKTIAIDPKNPAALVGLKSIRSAKGLSSKNIGEQIARERVEMPAISVRYANQLFGRMLFEDALPIYEWVSSEERDNVSFLAYRALCLSALNKEDEAHQIAKNEVTPEQRKLFLKVIAREIQETEGKQKPLWEKQYQALKDAWEKPEK